MEVVVSVGGKVVTVYNELLDLSDLGPARVTRASHVEPDDRGNWFAAIVDGPTLGPFERRSAAIDAEVQWLTEHRLLHPLRP